MAAWKLYAIAAAVFAGITAVLGKFGLKNIPADVGLAIRTLFVVAFVLIHTALAGHLGKLQETLHAASARTYTFLALSALATTFSWICYYRAVKDGSVMFVSLVDKGSILVTILLSALFLGEALTWRTGMGAVLIVAGLLVIAGGK
jgi:bacterial/archaeal transporter family protein